MSFLLLSRPPISLNFIDHIVGNVPDREMIPVTEWYFFPSILFDHKIAISFICILPYYYCKYPHVMPVDLT